MKDQEEFGADEFRESDEYEPPLAEGSRIIRTIHLETGVEEGPVRQVINMLGQLEGVYQQHGRLVQIVKPDAPADLDNTCLSEPSVQEIHSARLRNIISAAFRFTKPAPPNIGGGVQAAACPEWLTQAVMHYGEWRGVKPLTGVVSWPTMRRDGSFITEPGYDDTTGIIHRGERIAVPPCPSLQMAKESAALLLDLVKDFPFVNDAHRSSWLALPLSIIARHATGCTPLWVFDAPTPGSGKTLLARVASMIVTGRPMAQLTPSEDDDENRKRITTMVMDRVPACCIDNVIGNFGGAAFDAALTSDEWNDRILGKNARFRDVSAIVWAVTGNNVTIKGDMARRVLPCTIDPKMERPEERRLDTWELLSRVAEKQKQYLEATVILLKFGTFHDKLELPTWGSFERWSRIVRQAIVAVGLEDPWKTRSAFRVAADPERETKEALLRELRRFSVLNGAKTGRELLKVVDADTKELLAELCKCRDKDLTSGRMGYLFRKMHGRPMGGLVLTSEENRDGTAEWRVDQTMAAE